MRSTVKAVSALALLIVILPAIIYAQGRGHVYIHGRAEYISTDIVKISGTEYRIASDCEFSIQYERNGAIHEKRAAFSDLKTGDEVYAKKIGPVLYEIIIIKY